MKKEFNMFGICGKMNTTFDNEFETLYDESDNFFAESKKIYSHNEEGLNFKYKYCIEGVKCEGDTYYSLQLVPTPDSLHKKHYDSVCDCCGVDVPDIYDIASEGSCVEINTHRTINTSEEEFDMDILNQIANTIEMTEVFFGYAMDKPFNSMGISKWDLLKDFINGKDWTKKIGKC